MGQNYKQEFFLIQMLTFWKRRASWLSRSACLDHLGLSCLNLVTSPLLKVCSSSISHSFSPPFRDCRTCRTKLKYLVFPLNCNHCQRDEHLVGQQLSKVEYLVSEQRGEGEVEGVTGLEERIPCYYQLYCQQPTCSSLLSWATSVHPRYLRLAR